jgi:flagellin-like protein
MFDNSTDSGVSPVVGVILLVAVTIILSAVVFTVVTDQGDAIDQSQSSEIATSFEQGQNTVKATILKAGGGGELRVNGTEVANFSGGDTGRIFSLENLNEDSTVSVVSNNTNDAEQLYTPTSEVGNPANPAKVINNGGDGSGENSLEETFEGKSVSEVNTSTFSGTPDFEIVSRLGSDWGAVNLHKSESDIGGYVVQDGIKDGIVRVDSNGTSYQPFVIVSNSDGSKYVQFWIEDESNMAISYNKGSGNNLVTKDNVVSSSDLDDPYKIDYEIEDGSKLTFNLESSNGFSESLTVSDAPSDFYDGTVASAEARNGELGVFFDYIK